MQHSVHAQKLHNYLIIEGGLGFKWPIASHDSGKNSNCKLAPRVLERDFSSARYARQVL